MKRHYKKLLIVAVVTFFCIANAAENAATRDVTFSGKNALWKTEQQKEKIISDLKIIISNTARDPKLCIKEAVTFFLSHIGELSGKNRDFLELLLAEKINMTLLPVESFLEQNREKIDLAVKRKYPVSEIEYRKILRKQAVKQYRIIKLGDRVCLFNKTTQRSVFGRYTGMTAGNRGVIVNGIAIPFYDMSEQERAMFSKTATSKLREEYVEQKWSFYLKEKEGFKEGLQNSLLRSNGYILCDKKFFSPREYITYLLDEINGKQ